MTDGSALSRLAFIGPVTAAGVGALAPAAGVAQPGADCNRFALTHSAKLLAGLTLPNDVRRGVERDNAITLFDVVSRLGTKSLEQIKGISRSRLTTLPLAAAGLPVRVYGLGRRDSVGDVSFHEVDERRFVEDLTGCRGVVAAAGNQLIGEAIHLGKPLLVLPELAHAEQTINAHFLAAEGCGAFVPLERVDAAAIRTFLDHRERFAEPLAVRRGGMDGFSAAARAVADVMAADAGRHHAEIRTAA